MKRQNIKYTKRYFQILKNKYHAATGFSMHEDNEVYTNLIKLAAKTHRFVLVSTITRHKTVKTGKEIK